jgi:hypothetical protein
VSTLAIAALALAIVTQNQASLRAAPRDSAPQQAVMWQGEVLEIRGERGDFFSVYDHRRERGGYIRSAQVRATTLLPEEAPQLLAIVRFLRDTPGAEALGISYAAAYLKVAPAAAITAEPFDALGGMADRLALRASTPQTKAIEATLTAQLEVVAQLGLGMNSYERGASVQICYDGEMYRRVLAMDSADSTQQARAALSLTRNECVNPNLGPTARYQLDLWRSEVLAHVSLTDLSPAVANRLHMRHAGILSAIAFWQTRRGENGLMAASRALHELGAVSKAALDEHDQIEYADAAVRVGASRLAAEPVIGNGGKLHVRLAPGAPGETCVLLIDAKHDEPLTRRCTFGTVWTSSARSSADGSALTLAVQPLATWRELWVFRRSSNDWGVDVLPPGSETPELGYIEFAGWQPDSRHFMVVRELLANGRLRRRFEVVAVESLRTQRQAGTPDLVPGFGRWQDASWRATTVSLR